MPIDELAFELCRVWFDDIYAPGSRYIDGLKGNYSTAEAEKFWESFTKEERAALERFHRFFELRLEMLPKKARAREIFPQNDLWDSTTRDAGHVLEALAVDTGRLEQELSWIVRAAIIDQVTDE